MNRPVATLSAGLAGIALWSGLLLLAAAHLRRDEAMDAAPPPLAAPEDGAGARRAAAPLGATERRTVRTVEPDAFDFPLARDSSGYERIDPPRPLSDKTGPSTGPKPVPLARPGTVDAGLLVFGTRRLQLAGLVPTDHARRCIDPESGEWPCGIAARTAQRLFLRNRTIHCDLADGRWVGTVTAECRLGAKSIAAWLVETGWAEAAAGSPLEALGDAARAGRRGLYGEDPRKAAFVPPDQAAP